MNVAARLDEIGTPIWIALMVLSFFVFWPLGLAVLAYLRAFRDGPTPHQGWLAGSFLLVSAALL